MRTPFHAALALAALVLALGALAWPGVSPTGALVLAAAMGLAAALRHERALGAATAETARVERAVGAIEAAALRATTEARVGAPAAPGIGGARERRSAHDELLGALAHELRTPLNSIRGFAEVLESEIDGPLPEGAREEVELIRGAGEDLEALVAEVLDLAAGRAPDPRTAVLADLGALVRDVARTLEPRAAGKGLELEVRGALSAPSVRADGRRVRQILLNLGGNAVKYTSRGRVAIEVTTRGDRLAVAVRDTGPGIEPGARERIFSAWERVSEAEEGHGLGLAIARELATSMGARIEVESEVGAGSTFWLVLARGAEAAVASEKDGEP